jgi:hypothetical protein
MMNSMQVCKMYVEKASELKKLCLEDLTTFGAKLKLFSLGNVIKLQKILLSLYDHLFKEVKGKVKANREDFVHNDEDIYPKNDDDAESTKHEKFAGDQTLVVELEKMREEIKVLREENKHLSKELEKVCINTASAGTPKTGVGGGSPLLKTQPTTVRKLKDNARKKYAVATNHFEMLIFTYDGKEFQKAIHVCIHNGKD